MQSRPIGVGFLVLLLASSTTSLVDARALQNDRSNVPLMLISLDGFRYDYLTKFTDATPALNRLAAGEAAYAPRVRPVYLTKTAAIHWSLVTGQYPEVHGITNNKMFDPEFNETVNMFDTDDERWWNTSEPIWLTAEANGKRAGVYQWPGGHVAIGGRLPTHMIPRAKGGKGPQLSVGLDCALDWITNGRASLVLVYHDEPDWTGHGDGPEAVGPALAGIDETINKFIKKLQDRGLRDSINIIITSDHGMLPVNHNNTIRVNARSHPATRAVIEMGVALGLFAHPGRAEELRTAMRRDIADRPAQALLRQELPDRLHFKRHRRIPDVLLMPDKGYQLADTVDKVWKMGMHGADPDWDEMLVPLLAFGPAFKKGYRIESTASQTDIYALACRLIGLQPRPHNGSEKPLSDLLLPGVGSVNKPATLLLIGCALSCLFWLYISIE